MLVPGAGAGNEEAVFTEDRVSVWGDEGLVVDGGDSSTMCMCLTPSNC